MSTNTPCFCQGTIFSMMNAVLMRTVRPSASKGSCQAGLVRAMSVSVRQYLFAYSKATLPKVLV